MLTEEEDGVIEAALAWRTSGVSDDPNAEERLHAACDALIAARAQPPKAGFTPRISRLEIGGVRVGQTKRHCRACGSTSYHEGKCVMCGTAWELLTAPDSLHTFQYSADDVVDVEPGASELKLTVTRVVEEVDHLAVLNEPYDSGSQEGVPCPMDVAEKTDPKAVLSPEQVDDIIDESMRGKKDLHRYLHGGVTTGELDPKDSDDG